MTVPPRAGAPDKNNSPRLHGRGLFCFSYFFFVGGFMGIFNLFNLRKQKTVPDGPLSCRSPAPVSPSVTRLVDCWPSEYFESDSFFLRFHRVLYDLPSYTYSPVGSSSMHIYNPARRLAYFCTFNHCDCEDFHKRSAPCKHMIFLDILANGLDAFYKNTFGFSSQELNLLVSCDRCLPDLLDQFDPSGPVLSPRTSGLNRFIRNGYLTESFHDDILLSNLTRSELSSLIRISGNKPSGSKEQMVSWVLSNSRPIIDFCRKKYVFWDVAPDCKSTFLFLLHYYSVNDCFPKCELNTQNVKRY